MTLETCSRSALLKPVPLTPALNDDGLFWRLCALGGILSPGCERLNRNWCEVCRSVRMTQQAAFGRAKPALELRCVRGYVCARDLGTPFRRLQSLALMWSSDPRQVFKFGNGAFRDEETACVATQSFSQ